MSVNFENAFARVKELAADFQANDGYFRTHIQQIYADELARPRPGHSLAICLTR